MKILVVEDSKIHQESAIAQLEAEGYTLVIMQSFTEFARLTNGLVRANRGYSKPEVDLGSFDAVLTDVNLPSFNDENRDEPTVATGFLVAMAALKAGVKMVGIITDANHHKDYISKGFDMFSLREPVVIADTKIVLANSCSICEKEGDKLVSRKNWLGLLNSLMGKRLVINKPMF